FMFWGAEQLERIVAGKDLHREPKARLVGAGALLALALAVMFSGLPSLEERYNKLTFNRAETGSQPGGDPIVNTYRYPAEEMLEKRLVHIAPAELFKTIHNQDINLITLDVRAEADYNIYHIRGARHILLEEILSITDELLAQPQANSVFVVMSNDEVAA